MKYLSVCSGIEAATSAWHDLGWEPVAFSEIEQFPSAVLKHHYPDVPNLGDMTKFEEWNLDSIDLLVGGTPCQSFSVAGLRKGLDDPRGNLMLTYGAIAKRFSPKWLVWENVPGVLSSNGGRDFATFLGMLAELGYGFAYRICDAQYWGVAQRRRRVFVVGCLGDWRAAAAVLFERHSLSGNPAPSRESRQGTARGATQSVANCLTSRMHKGMNSTLDEGQTPILEPMGIPDVMSTLLSSTAGISRPGNAATEHETYIPLGPIAIQDTRGIDKAQGGKGWNDKNIAYTLDTHATQGVARPIPFGVAEQQDVGHCLRAGASKADKHESTTYVAQPIPIDTMNHIGRKDNHSFGDFEPGAPSYTLTKGHSHAVAIPAMAVRRLTPRECERLQGFPDDHTLIPWRGKEAPDGPRYKALGNSMAVPVMAWIGKRIGEVNELQK